jgi:hypothetical protein
MFSKITIPFILLVLCQFKPVVSAGQCTQPSAISLTQTAATCTGITPNNNGSISLSAVIDGTHYGVSTLNASSYDGPITIALATPVPGTLPAVIQSSIPNIGGTYIIRLFNTTDDCYTDETVTVAVVTCTCPTPNCATATIMKS